MPIYTIVDQEICIACGACSMYAAGIYDYNDEGLSTVILDNNMGTAKIPKESEEYVQDACAGCPTDAIKISDQPFCGDPLQHDKEYK